MPAFTQSDQFRAYNRLPPQRPAGTNVQPISTRPVLNPDVSLPNGLRTSTGATPGGFGGVGLNAQRQLQQAMAGNGAGGNVLGGNMAQGGQLAVGGTYGSPAPTGSGRKTTAELQSQMQSLMAGRDAATQQWLANHGAPAPGAGGSLPPGVYTQPGGPVQNDVMPGSATLPPANTQPQQGTGYDQALGDYWNQNPTDLAQSISQNPQAFGQTPDQNPLGIAPMQYGLTGVENAVQGGLNTGLNQVQQGLNQAAGTLSPYTQGGGQAYNLQMALSGAMGPQAQQQAYANYQESPGQAYLRDMGEKAILRNSAATGGLGGGRVMQELQRHGIGLAAQDFQNSFNRLGSLSGMGQSSANLLGGLQAQGGFQGGEMGYGAGNNLASARQHAGDQIANNMQGTTSALSDLINSQGSGMAGMTGQTGGNLANLIAQYGRETGLSQQQLATVLANISTGSGSQVAGLPGLGGTQQDNTLSNIGNLAFGAGTLIAASDRRLKTNITRIGKTPGGVNLYSWQWNAEGERIGGGPTVGVIAQEVPEAAIMGDDGYLRVDYRRVK